ncbi:MFS transporter [uncultured Shewanella sp.]|uniref:MFS transporter n=1 Tax=uncultured Shewanella sp. TaxID=173975 RepID=UPI00262E48EA|nr:MFS transporter [uncultured Shewanella sp.]
MLSGFLHLTRHTLLTTSIVYIEWLEYSLYLYLGTVISQYFFPTALGDNALLFTYGIFAISYLGRPCGGFIFGYFADKHGRRLPLIISSFLIGISTISIGLIPSYQQLGVIAPLLLLLCRLVQSIAVAGEFNNASIYLIEHAKKHKILAGSWVGTAATAGMFTGCLIAFVLSQSASMGNWRLAFIITGIISLIIMIFRSYLTESPQFVKQKLKIQSLSLYQQTLKHKRGLLKIGLIAAFMCLYIYTCNVYFMSYMITKLNYSMSTASYYMMLVQACTTLLIPLIAMTSEHLGLHRVLKSMIPLICLMSLLLFKAASLQDHHLILLGLILYVIGDAGISATIFKYMFDALPLDFRCTGNSSIYSLAIAIVGGTAPMIAAFFINQNLLMAPAYYICLMGLLAYLSI